MAKRAPKAKQSATTASGHQLFELDVALFSGPISRPFAKRNRVVARVIQIRSDQTLEALHEAIFNAFDRFDEHLYEFQFGGKQPHDPDARSYVLDMMMDDPLGTRRPAGSVSRTTIGSLGLRTHDVFGYWFDFGDDWWHQVTVLDVRQNAPPGRYPKIVSRTGESPPQYLDPDQDE